MSVLLKICLKINKCTSIRDFVYVTVIAVKISVIFFTFFFFTLGMPSGVVFPYISLIFAVSIMLARLCRRTPF